jgi:hypothetical protein
MTTRSETREERAARTDKEARALIDFEAARRAEKTVRLRALRLANAAVSPQAPAKARNGRKKPASQ